MRCNTAYVRSWPASFRPSLLRWQGAHVFSRLAGRHYSVITPSTAATDCLTSSDDAFARETTHLDATASELSASRACSSALPPFGSKETLLRQLDDGLWSLTQSFVLTRDIKHNSLVARLQDDSLLVWSPLAATEECQQLMATIPGDVSHIVLPNLSPEHWYHAPDLAKRWPEAIIWVCPGALEGSATAGILGGRQMFDQLRKSHRVHVMANGAPPGLEGQVEFQVFQGALGLYTESTMYLPRHKLFTLADLGFSDSTEAALHADPINKALSKMAGVYGRLGAPLAFAFFAQDPSAGRAWRDAVSTWPWERIFCAHFEPFLTKDARLQFERCFTFVKPVE